jgi:hypothetical protein
MVFWKTFKGLMKNPFQKTFKGFSNLLGFLRKPLSVRYFCW